MKNIKLFIFILISMYVSSQSVDEILTTLPDEVRSSIINEELKNIDNENIAISNNLEQLETFQKDAIEEEPFFGYSFFETSSNTNLPVLDLPLQSDYKLSFNDELELLMTGNEQKLIKLRIDLSGNVLLPEIGSISLLNLSLSEANKKISSIVKDTYIGTESFLSVSKPSLKKISVIGAVKKPGTYLVNPFISVTEAIKYAGGLNDNSSIRNIKIITNKDNLQEIDLYDFLIMGNRKSDINLQNGDTVMVSATSKFVQIDGEVLRANRYEYLPTDSVADLLSFAQGLTNKANTDNIFINAIADNQLNTYAISEEKFVGNLKLEGLNVGSTVAVSRKKVFVSGSSVTSGYFDYVEGELLADFLNKLSFSDNIYPFFFIISQDSGSGLQTEFFNPSLADPITYRNIKLAQNVNIEFFSKNWILQMNEIDNKFNPNLSKPDLLKSLDITDAEYSEWQRLKKVLPKDKISFIKIGDKNLSIPLSGRITAQSIYDYLGQNIEIDLQNVSVATREKIILESFSKPFNAEDILSISFPPKPNLTVKVRISGNVSSPGTYTLPIKTSLNDLYEIAGGLLEGASSKGIVVSREAIKELEREALEGAKRVIMDSVISQQTNALAQGNNPNFDFSSLAALMAETAVTGRVTGDFSPESISSKQLILQDGDEIFIPSVLSTVTVTGEVLNPITTGFETDLNYEDYIEAAGGLTSFADNSEIYIIKANGTSIKYSKGFFNRNQYPEPGDTIVIPRDYNQIQGLPLVSVATKIISDIAFAAASLNSLSN